jgi:hypothetical protein
MQRSPQIAAALRDILCQFSQHHSDTARSPKYLIRLTVDLRYKSAPITQYISTLALKDQWVDVVAQKVIADKALDAGLQKAVY